MTGSAPLGFSGAQAEACPCPFLGCILRAVSQPPFPLWIKNRAKQGIEEIFKKVIELP